MSAAMPLWLEVVVGLLLLASGVFVLVAALGLVRFKTFFMRMHPPALTFTIASWCVTLATILYFSMLEQSLALHAWLIIIFLSMTVPVTTIMLSRAALFRSRTLPGASEPVPPSLNARRTGTE